MCHGCLTRFVPLERRNSPVENSLAVEIIYPACPPVLCCGILRGATFIPAKYSLWRCPVNTFCRATLALLLAVVSTGVVSAEPQQPASPQADKAHWQELLAQKETLEKEIENKVRTIQERMQTAPPQERPSIQAEYQRMAQDYLKKYQAVTNQLLPLAAMIYQRNPQDTAAAEIVMQQAFSKNQYQKAAEIADRLIGVGHVTPITLNMGGAAHFNIHDFQKAHQLLERAQKEKMLDQLGGQYLSDSNEYQAIWEKERALRAAEAAMEPDHALPQVLLKTSRGDILLELFEDQAPNTVANFIRPHREQRLRRHEVPPRDSQLHGPGRRPQQQRRRSEKRWIRGPPLHDRLRMFPPGCPHAFFRKPEYGACRQRYRRLAILPHPPSNIPPQ